MLLMMKSMLLMMSIIMLKDKLFLLMNSNMLTFKSKPLFTMSLNTLFMYLMMPMTIIIYLFIALIVVSKITYIKKGFLGKNT